MPRSEWSLDLLNDQWCIIWLGPHQGMIHLNRSANFFLKPSSNSKAWGLKVRNDFRTSINESRSTDPFQRYWRWYKTNKRLFKDSYCFDFWTHWSSSQGLCWKLRQMQRWICLRSAQLWISKRGESREREPRTVAVSKRLEGSKREPVAWMFRLDFTLFHLTVSKQFQWAASDQKPSIK